MLGPAILVTPVLAQGATSVNGVFPGSQQNQVWYDWYTNAAIPVTSDNITISAPLGHIPVYIRGGYVLPLQVPAMTTNEVRKSPWSLLVALNVTGMANGYLYIDDGVSIYPSAIKEISVREFFHWLRHCSLDITHPRCLDHCIEVVCRRSRDRRLCRWQCPSEYNDSRPVDRSRNGKIRQSRGNKLQVQQ